MTSFEQTILLIGYPHERGRYNIQNVSILFTFLHHIYFFSYAKNAKELSLIYHDLPIKASTELVHWVEHVVRTRGAPHLLSPALHVPLYQRLYLDLLAIVLGLIALFYYIVSSLFKKSHKKKTDQKKKN